MFLVGATQAATAMAIPCGMAYSFAGMEPVAALSAEHPRTVAASKRTASRMAALLGSLLSPAQLKARLSR